MRRGKNKGLREKGIPYRCHTPNQRKAGDPTAARQDAKSKRRIHRFPPADVRACACFVYDAVDPEQKSIERTEAKSSKEISMSGGIREDRGIEKRRWKMLPCPVLWETFIPTPMPERREVCCHRYHRCHRCRSCFPRVRCRGRPSHRHCWDLWLWLRWLDWRPKRWSARCCYCG